MYEMTATAQKILASMPMSNDVVGLHAWAFEKGMPPSASEPLLFLCMALLRAHALEISAVDIRKHVVQVLESIQVQGDITSHLNVEPCAGWEAMAFADFAITFLVERGAPNILVFEFVDRFLALMQVSTVPC